MYPWRFNSQSYRGVSLSQLPQLPSPEQFASELMSARAEKGYTQAQLAQVSGLSISAIKAYESGRNLPGARELRELCQALEISPNKLLFGTEAPFKERSFANLLVDAEGEDEMVARMRATMLLGLLASDERASVLVLVKALALARHGQEKVTEVARAADAFSGIAREFFQGTREAVVAKKPVDPQKFAQGLADFMDRQGHKPDPKKLPKK